MERSDLNLLAVFDTLFELRSVTLTAQRLNLTQPAVSHSLRRLREAVGDPLFVRQAGALQPTSRACEMAPAVREGLTRLRGAMAPVNFAPERSSRTFTIAATSYFCALLIPRLIVAVRKQAPGITIRTVPVTADLLTGLDAGTIDVALGAFPRIPQTLLLEPLFHERLAWIAGNGHPSIEAGLSHDELLKRPHLVLDPIRTFEPLRPRGSAGAVEMDSSTEQQIPSRADGTYATPVIVYDALTAIAVVAETDLIALVPWRLALVEERQRKIVIFNMDEARPGIDLGMVSTTLPASDPGRAWLRALVLELANVPPYR